MKCLQSSWKKNKRKCGRTENIDGFFSEILVLAEVLIALRNCRAIEAFHFVLSKAVEGTLVKGKKKQHCDIDWRQSSSFQQEMEECWEREKQHFCYFVSNCKVGGIEVLEFSLNWQAWNLSNEGNRYKTLNWKNIFLVCDFTIFASTCTMYMYMYIARLSQMPSIEVEILVFLVYVCYCFKAKIN